VGSRCRGCFLYNNESKHEAWERNYRERGGGGVRVLVSVFLTPRYQCASFNTRASLHPIVKGATPFSTDCREEPWY
jgi:hypothetical protein